MRKFELYNKVKVKSLNIIGFIVNITVAGKYDVEKDGNEGPVYFNIDETDMEKV